MDVVFNEMKQRSKQITLKIDSMHEYMDQDKCVCTLYTYQTRLFVGQMIDITDLNWKLATLY